ncbi:hypothetical protein F8S13_21375 [Chloroflexia bacterium SDU3-3]|nr:hypothetical protein F8S13_21375 [Chloroflexia bacterium SDU3-3]
MSFSIPTRFERARTIFGVIDTRRSLQERLATVGYDDPVLAAGKSLYASALELRLRQQAAHLVKVNMTERARQLYQRLKASIHDLGKIAKAIFAGNRSALEALGLQLGTMNNPRGKQSRRQSVIVERARKLYDGLLTHPELLATIAAVGYTFERLTAERDLIAQVEQADIAQESAKADALTASREQNEAFKALDVWLQRFVAVVAVALKDMPEELKALGIRPSR